MNKLNDMKKELKELEQKIKEIKNKKPKRTKVISIKTTEKIFDLIKKDAEKQEKTKSTIIHEILTKHYGA